MWIPQFTDPSVPAKPKSPSVAESNWRRSSKHLSPSLGEFMLSGPTKRRARFVDCENNSLQRKEETGGWGFWRGEWITYLGDMATAKNGDDTWARASAATWEAPWPHDGRHACKRDRRQPQASYGGNPNRERRQHHLASPLGNFEKLTKRTNSCERGSLSALVNINSIYDPWHVGLANLYGLRCILVEVFYSDTYLSCSH